MSIPVVVSSGFRHGTAVVLGVVTDDDQVKDGEAGQRIGEGSNLIGLGAELSEEAL